MVLYYYRLGLLARERAAAVRRAPHGSLFGEGAGALVLETEASATHRNAPVLGEYPGRRLRLRSAGTDRDPRRRRRRRARGQAGARRRGNSGGGRRDDRRARQRNAAVGCIGGRRDSRGVRRESASGHRVQVVVRPPDRRRRDRRNDARARGAQARQRARHRDVDHAGPGLRGRSGLRIARRRRRATSRSSSAAASRAPTPRSSFARSSAPRAMADTAATPERCGIDTVELRAHRATAGRDAGSGTSAAGSAHGNWPTRVARVTAPRAWPRASRRRRLARSSSRARRRWGSSRPRISRSPPTTTAHPRSSARRRAQAALGRHRIARIELSLTHDRASASAVALAVPARTEVPLAGRILYRWFPIRRDIILDNLTRVYGDRIGRDEIVRLAQAHYGALVAALRRVLQVPLALRRAQGGARPRREPRGADRGIRARQGRARADRPLRELGGGDDRRHRPLPGRSRALPLRAPRAQAGVARRARDSSLQCRRIRRAAEARLARRDPRRARSRATSIVFPFDQHAQPPDGIEVDFFGHPAWTFKSLAIIALATGAPVLPATSWREADGRHVLRFEDALPPVESPDTKEAIRATTRAYNEALERLILARPEQWYWVHRRWKSVARRKGAAKAAGA